MSKRKIVDHQITGKQKLAITRNKNRSLDSLDSEEDKKIREYIAKWVGNWTKISDKENVHYLKRRHRESPEVELKKLQEKEKNLQRMLSSAINKKKLDLVVEYKKYLTRVREQIKAILEKRNNDRSI